jgi:hypothetical protein
MPDPYPGVKKSPDHGFGFAILTRNKANNTDKYTVLRMISSVDYSLEF